MAGDNAVMTIVQEISLSIDTGTASNRRDTSAIPNTSDLTLYRLANLQFTSPPVDYIQSTLVNVVICSMRKSRDACVRVCVCVV